MKEFSQMRKDIKSSNKRKTVQRLISFVVISSCLVYLFNDKFKEEGFYGAVLLVTIMMLFGLSFVTPALLIGRYEKKEFYNSKNLKITLILYLLGMVIAGLISEKWQIIFIFPGISILWGIVTFIEIEIKKRFKI